MFVGCACFQVLSSLTEGVQRVSLKAGPGIKGVTAVVVFSTHHAASMAKKTVPEGKTPATQKLQEQQCVNNEAKQRCNQSSVFEAPQCLALSYFLSILFLQDRRAGSKSFFVSGQVKRKRKLFLTRIY